MWVAKLRQILSIDSLVSRHECRTKTHRTQRPEQHTRKLINRMIAPQRCAAAHRGSGPASGASRALRRRWRASEQVALGRVISSMRSVCSSCRYSARHSNGSLEWYIVLAHVTREVVGGAPRVEQRRRGSRNARPARGRNSRRVRSRSALSRAQAASPRSSMIRAGQRHRRRRAGGQRGTRSGARCFLAAQSAAISRAFIDCGLSESRADKERSFAAQDE